MLKEDKINALKSERNIKQQLSVSQCLDIEKSFHLLNHLYQKAHDAIAVLDSELYIKMLNPSFIDVCFHIFGVNVQVGMNLGILLHERPDLKAKMMDAFQQAMQGHKTTVLIENHSHHLESYYFYEFILDAFDNQNAQQAGFILSIRNLTQFKLEERQQHKKHAELYAASTAIRLNVLVSAFAHEMSQPLTAIIAYGLSCPVIIKNTLQNELACKQILFPIEQIARQATQASEMIQNLKSVVDHNHFSVEELDINQLIQDTLSILNHEFFDFKIKMTLDLIDNMPKIKVNKIYMVQVILNLAQNSIESLKNLLDVKPELIIKTRMGRKYIVVHVMDNGPIVSDVSNDKIFKSYFTKKSEGSSSSMALGVCRFLVEAHGGKINLQKHAKNGAWYTVTLPIVSM